MNDLRNRVDEYAKRIKIEPDEGHLCLEEEDYNEYVRDHPTWESFSADIMEASVAWGAYACLTSVAAQRLVILASLQQISFPDQAKSTRNNLEYIQSYFAEDRLRREWDREGLVICLRLLIRAFGIFSDESSDSELEIWAKFYSEPCAVLCRIVDED